MGTPYCDGAGFGGDSDSDTSFEDRSLQWHADRPGADVFPEPTLSGEEDELTDVDDHAGRQRAVALTALDQHAAVTLGMGGKPVHRCCESCQAVARESSDGSCPVCGAAREVDVVSLPGEAEAPEEGSESSDEEMSIEDIPIPVPGGHFIAHPYYSPTSSEAGSDEPNGWLLEDSIAFFAEFHNRTGHARNQAAERRLVEPCPKAVSLEAAESAFLSPNEASAEGSTLCSQKVESLTDFPRALLTKLLAYGGSPVPQDYVSELMH
jgi:hypothetical protein